MPRFLADEDFDNGILRGLLRRYPKVDVIRVQDVGLSGVGDEGVLEWAANELRIVLTHDHSTMAGHAYERVRRGQAMPGLVEVPQEMPVGSVLEDVALLVECSLEGEWEGQVIYLPLK